MISASARCCRHRGIRLSLLLLACIGIGLYGWLPQPFGHPSTGDGGGQHFGAVPVAPLGGRGPAHPSVDPGASNNNPPPLVPAERNRAHSTPSSELGPRGDAGGTQLRSRACRNTAQGPVLFADESGYVCNITTLDVAGCCPENEEQWKGVLLPKTTGKNVGRNDAKEVYKRYSCASCREDYCCKSYPLCVSCCSNPQNDDFMGKVVLSADKSRKQVFTLADDLFDKCMIACRTTATSVSHENKYRDHDHAYCYGTTPAAKVPSDIK